jgi:hypothetical protein
MWNVHEKYPKNFSILCKVMEEKEKLGEKVLD